MPAPNALSHRMWDTDHLFGKNRRVGWPLMFVGFAFCCMSSWYPRFGLRSLGLRLIDGVFIDHTVLDPSENCDKWTVLSGKSTCESEQFEAAQNNQPPSLQRDVFFFNITNPQEVLRGALPQVHKLIPIKLKSTRGEPEIDADTLNKEGVLRLRSSLTWALRDDSQQAMLDTEIVLPNPSAAALQSKATLATMSKVAGSPLFVRMKVREALGWGGAAFADPLANNGRRDFNLARNTNVSDAQWSEFYAAESHKDLGLRYARTDLGMRYHCGFDHDCVTQANFSKVHPDSCTPDATCQPAFAGGFTTQPGFSYIPSGDFLYHANKPSTEYWNIKRYWSKDSNVSIQIPGHFARVLLQRSPGQKLALPGFDVKGAGTVRWEAIGIERRLESCDAKKKQNSSDSPGIDCNGYLGMAHVGAAMDPLTQPPLYLSLPGRTLNATSPAFLPKDPTLQTFVDAAQVTGMVLRSQIAVQINLHIGGPNRSAVFPEVQDALVPLYIVRDHSEAGAAHIERAIQLESIAPDFKFRTIVFVILAVIFLTTGFLILRGPRYFVEMLDPTPWTVPYKDDAPHPPYKDE